MVRLLCPHQAYPLPHRPGAKSVDRRLGIVIEYPLEGRDATPLVHRVPTESPVNLMIHPAATRGHQRAHNHPESILVTSATTMAQEEFQHRWLGALASPPTLKAIRD